MNQSNFPSLAKFDFERRSKRWPTREHFLFTSSDYEPQELIEEWTPNRQKIRESLTKVRPQKNRGKAINKAISKVAKILDRDAADMDLRKLVAESWLGLHVSGEFLKRAQDTVTLRAEIEKYTGHRCKVEVAPDGSIRDSIAESPELVSEYLIASGRAARAIGDCRPGRIFLPLSTVPDLVASAYAEVPYNRSQYADPYTFGHKYDAAFRQYLERVPRIQKLSILDVAMNFDTRVLADELSLRWNYPPASVGERARDTFVLLRHFLDWCDREGVPIEKQLRMSRMHPKELESSFLDARPYGRPYVNWPYWRSLPTVTIEQAACLVHDIDPDELWSIKNVNEVSNARNTKRRIESAILTGEIKPVAEGHVPLANAFMYCHGIGLELAPHLASRACFYTSTFAVIEYLAKLWRDAEARLIKSLDATAESAPETGREDSRRNIEQAPWPEFLRYGAPQSRSNEFGQMFTYLLQRGKAGASIRALKERFNIGNSKIYEFKGELVRLGMLDQEHGTIRLNENALARHLHHLENRM